jgi:hypothetical protein
MHTRPSRTPTPRRRTRARTPTARPAAPVHMAESGTARPGLGRSGPGQAAPGSGQDRNARSGPVRSGSVAGRVCSVPFRAGICPLSGHRSRACAGLVSLPSISTLTGAKLRASGSCTAWCGISTGSYFYYEAIGRAGPGRAGPPGVIRLPVHRGLPSHH